MSDAGAVMLDNVSIRYGRRAAVEKLSLRVDAGEIFGLLGPNGSGKSSTLAAIAGLLEPFDGTVRVGGLSHRKQPREYARRIGFVPQEIALYEELSGYANLDFIASLYDIPRRERRPVIGQILERLGLADRANDRVGTYSGGMKRRVNLAAALLHDPSVLLLDEASVALDPDSRDVFFGLLDELRERGRIIILATHHLEEATQWCDRVGILSAGRLTAVGRPDEVLPRRLQIFGRSRDEIAAPPAERSELPCSASLG